MFLRGCHLSGEATHFITPPANGVHQPIRTPAAASVSLVHWLQVLRAVYSPGAS
jgi:hypothetical protein